MKKKYTIGIIDEEQTERNRLHNFFETKFIVKEIRKFDSIENLIAVIKSEAIDALAIDYKLKEHNSKFAVNGDVIFKELLASLNGFPAFILTNDSSRAKKESKLISSFFIIDKDKLTDIAGKDAFLKEINNNIDVYKDSLKIKMKRLKALTDKKKQGRLTASDENEFLELNNELAKSITGTSPLPLKYFSKETNKKLDEIISKTDKLISKFKNK